MRWEEGINRDGRRRRKGNDPDLWIITATAGRMAERSRERGAADEAVALLRDVLWLTRLADDRCHYVQHAMCTGTTAKAARDLSKCVARASGTPAAGGGGERADDLRACIHELQVSARWPQIFERDVLAECDLSERADAFGREQWDWPLRRPFVMLGRTGLACVYMYVARRGYRRTFAELGAPATLAAYRDSCRSCAFLPTHVIPVHPDTHVQIPFDLPYVNTGPGYYLQDGTACELVATALALRLYEWQHGAPPAALADLVPEYLEYVPRDPFNDGAPPIVWHQGADAFLSAGETEGDPADPSAYPLALRAAGWRDCRDAKGCAILTSAAGGERRTCGGLPECRVP